MGGTSTDVSLVDGELPQRFEHLIAGARLNQPMLDVHSIAAGGGSILSYHDGRFAVGPASAGAEPGPVCYGRGGPLTLRSEEHTSELQSRLHLVCRLLLEKKKNNRQTSTPHQYVC